MVGNTGKRKGLVRKDHTQKLTHSKTALEQSEDCSIVAFKGTFADLELELAMLRAASCRQRRQAESKALGIAPKRHLARTSEAA